MPMAPFHQRFPDISLKETRTLTVQGLPDLPDGDYGFIESYCDEAGCDCRRVLLTVISSIPGSPIQATINFGWESAAYYAKWTSSPGALAMSVGAYLDPINPQSRHADALIRVFQSTVADEVYVERLKRHYALFKNTCPGATVRKGSKVIVKSRRKRRSR